MILQTIKPIDRFAIGFVRVCGRPEFVPWPKEAVRKEKNKKKNSGPAKKEVLEYYVLAMAFLVVVVGVLWNKE